MKRSQRDGKVFIDWSQNNGAKTTVSPVLTTRPGPAVGRRAADLGGTGRSGPAAAGVRGSARAGLADLGDPLAPLAPQH